MRNLANVSFLIGLLCLSCGSCARRNPGPGAKPAEADASGSPDVIAADSGSPLAPDARPVPGLDTGSSTAPEMGGAPPDAVDGQTPVPAPCDAGAAADPGAPYCKATGVSPPPDCLGFCAPPPAIGDVTFNTLASAYAGSSPRCQDEDQVPPPGWRIKVEKVVVQPYGSDPASHHFVTVVSGSRIDLPTPCGVAIWIMLRDEKVNLAVGTVIRYATKRTIRNPENDVSSSTTIRDADGHLLLAFVMGQRPQVWDAEFFPGLTLGLEQGAFCQQRGFKVRQLRAHLKTGSDDCALDCYTRRCCTLAGETFEVRADSVVRYETTSGPQQDVVTLLIRRPGVVVPQ
jgi:hypothetical protein